MTCAERNTDRSPPRRTPPARPRPVLARALARRERGSVLLMVIGVLALMSIIAVVYVAIGKADRAQSAALTRRTDLDIQAALVADYLAGVIRDDTTSTTRQSIGQGNTAASIAVREAWDSPWTDQTKYLGSTWNGQGSPSTATLRNALVVSQPTRATTHLQTLPRLSFNPAGDGDDPFLASTEAVFINHDNTLFTQAERSRNRRDWLHITNIAPDGRFVNLRNIRNNWGALPGIGSYTDSQGRTLRRTTHGLTLYNIATGAPQSAGADGLAPQKLDDGTVADLNIPAHWSDRQVLSFRPVGELGTAPGTPLPSAYEYLPNQWADADGDGMADSRWFELFNASDPNNPFSVVNLSGSARLFIAARVMDLSACLNVNLHTDFTDAPTFAYPAGLTPADIDLRRFLTMDDARHLYGSNTQTGAQGGYEQYNAPTLPASAANYAQYNQANADKIGRAAYAALRLSLNTGDPVLGNLGGDPDNAGIIDDAGTSADWTSRISPFHLLPPAGPPGPAVETGASLRAKHYEAMVGLRSGRAGLLNPDTVPIAQPFGLDDELELRAFNGFNTPAGSRLEKVMGGRLQTGPAGTDRMSPLRDNRPMDLERSGLARTAPVADGQASDTALLMAATDARRRLTTLSGSRPLRASLIDFSTTDGELTTADERVDIIGLLHAAAPRVRTGSYGTLPPERLPADSFAYPANLVKYAVDRIFHTYAAALAPSLALPAPDLGNNQQPYLDGMWTDQNGANSANATLFYGYRGPQIALTAAGHLTLNLIDAYDDDVDLVSTVATSATADPHGVTAAGADNEPTVAFLRLASGSPHLLVKHPLITTPLYDTNPQPQPGPEFTPTLVTLQGQARTFGLPFHVLDIEMTADPETPGGLDGLGHLWPRDQTPALDPPRKPTDGTPYTIGGAAVGTGQYKFDGKWLFGVEAQAFITQAAMFIIYRDAPCSSNDAHGTACGSGPDADAEWRWTDSNNDNIIDAGELNTDPVTINPRIDTANKDFVAQIFAVQVHNPFDFDVDLKNYEVQLGDYRYYNPVRAGGTTILKAGDTVVLYSTNPTNVNRLLTGNGAEYDYAWLTGAWVAARFSVPGSPSGATPIELSQRARLVGPDFTTLGPVVAAADVVDMLAGDPLNAAAPTGTQLPDAAKNSVVYLWKRLAVNGSLAEEHRVLLDRLHDPAPFTGPAVRPTLDRRLSTGTVPMPITGALAGPQPGVTGVNGPVDSMQNTGYAITMWGSIQRPVDPSSGTPHGIPLGAIPAYCIELRSSATDLNAANLRGNRGETDGSSPLQLINADFQNLPGATTMAMLRTTQTVATVNMARDMNEEPKNKTNITARANRIGPLNPNPAANASPLDGLNDSGVPFTRLYPRIYLHNRQFSEFDAGPNPPNYPEPARHSTLRVGDLVLPLMIGPELLHRADQAAWMENEPEQMEAAWLTLSESLARALDFDGPNRATLTNPTPPTLLPRDTYVAAIAGLVGPTPTLAPLPTERRPFHLWSDLSDRGHLRLDDFVPFVDHDYNDAPTNLVGAPGTTPKGGGVYTISTNPLTGGDERRGLGIPLALNILNDFKTLRGGSLDRPDLGRLNVNTAFETTLKANPMLAPYARQAVQGTWALGDTWTANTISTSAPNPPDVPAGRTFVDFNTDQDADANATFLYDPFTSTYDVAAMLEAYAHKHDVAPRVPRGNSAGGNLPLISAFSEADDLPNTHGAGVWLATDQFQARQIATRIPGLREDPGLASLGELMCAIVRNDGVAASASRDGYAPTNPAAAFPDADGDSSITRFGYDAGGDRVKTTQPGLTPPVIDTAVAVAAGNPPRLKADGLYDDYAEQVSIASAVLNTLSVRSDVFCVWFIVHGYTQSDCDNLGPNDPMVPSIARRYVMVVDRSNVKSRADKPRILLVQELPM